MAALKRILVADDDPDVQQLLAAALEASGRQIDGARDGLEALSRVEAVRYDLVLTDLHMPGLDGLALLERIRRSRPDTKVVVMTGSGTPESVVRSIREQAFTYFSKPFAIRAVIEMVASALSETSLEDDIEVLSARPNWLALRLRCRMETAGRLLQFMHELGGDLPANQWENVATAFREILLNAIEHGGGSDPEKWVRITYVRTARVIIYHVRDPGPGFSFADLPHAAVSNPESSPFEHTEVRNRMGMRPGGFGILMTRRMSDELIYNEAGNEAMLIKYLD